MALYHEDYVDVDLGNGNIHRSFMKRSIGQGDKLANKFGVRLFRNGEPVNAGGATCIGLFMAPDGQNILVSGDGIAGTTGNTAWVILPQACYNVEGQFSLALKVVGSTMTGTMRIIDGVVDNTGVTGAVAPVESVPTYQEIIAVYEQMLEAKEGAIRYDIEQDLTAEERNQARNNIGMLGVSFTQISGDDYMMVVSTQAEWELFEDQDYILVTMAD